MRLELGDDLHRLTPGESVEPGEHRLPVLRGHHLRRLDDAREAEVAPPERLDDPGDLLDEPGGDLAVLGRALGEPELPVQVVEERGMPQLHPEPPLVEVRERDEKLGEGVVLAA